MGSGGGIEGSDLGMGGQAGLVSFGRKGQGQEGTWVPSRVLYNGLEER